MRRTSGHGAPSTVRRGRDRRRQAVRCRQDEARQVGLRQRLDHAARGAQVQERARRHSVHGGPSQCSSTRTCSCCGAVPASSPRGRAGIRNEESGQAANAVLGTTGTSTLHGTFSIPDLIRPRRSATKLDATMSPSEGPCCGHGHEHRRLLRRHRSRVRSVQHQRRQAVRGSRSRRGPSRLLRPRRWYVQHLRPDPRTPSRHPAGSVLFGTGLQQNVELPYGPASETVTGCSCSVSAGARTPVRGARTHAAPDAACSRRARAATLACSRASSRFLAEGIFRNGRSRYTACSQRAHLTGLACARQEFRLDTLASEPLSSPG